MLKYLTTIPLTTNSTGVSYFRGKITGLSEITEIKRIFININGVLSTTQDLVSQLVFYDEINESDDNPIPKIRFDWAILDNTETSNLSINIEFSFNNNNNIGIGTFNVYQRETAEGSYFYTNTQCVKHNSENIGEFVQFVCGNTLESIDIYFE